MVREPIRQIFFCLDLCSFWTEVPDLETPKCLARVEVIKCPEYLSDQPYEFSIFSENPTCFKNANIANPFHSALGSDFFEPGSKEIQSTERPQAALKSNGKKIRSKMDTGSIMRRFECSQSPFFDLQFF